MVHVHERKCTDARANAPMQCDTASAPHHIRRIRSALPGEPAVAMSAASERWLNAAARKGNVSYEVCCGAAGNSKWCSREQRVVHQR